MNLWVFLQDAGVVAVGTAVAAFILRGLFTYTLEQMLAATRNRNERELADLRKDHEVKLAAIDAEYKRDHEHLSSELARLNERAATMFTRLSERQVAAIHEVLRTVNKAENSCYRLLVIIELEAAAHSDPTRLREARMAYKEAVAEVVTTYRDSAAYFDSSFDILLTELSNAMDRVVRDVEDAVNRDVNARLARVLGVADHYEPVTVDGVGDSPEPPEDSLPEITHVLEAGYRRLFRLRVAVLSYFRTILRVSEDAPVIERWVQEAE